MPLPGSRGVLRSRPPQNETASTRSTVAVKLVARARKNEGERRLKTMNGKSHATEALATQLQDRPLRDLTAQALERYLARLGGHDPDDLYGLVMSEVEPAMLATVLHHAQGNQSRAASILGLNRGTLRRKLREYGLLS